MRRVSLQALDRRAGVEVVHQPVEEVLRVGVALGTAHAGLEEARIAHDRPVVAERVVAEAERMGVLEAELAHRRAAHVDVEDAPAHRRRLHELEVRVGGLGKADQLRLGALGSLVNGHAPAGVVLLGLADQRILRLEQLVSDRNRVCGDAAEHAAHRRMMVSAPPAGGRISSALALRRA